MKLGNKKVYVDKKVLNEILGETINFITKAIESRVESVDKEKRFLLSTAYMECLVASIAKSWDNLKKDKSIKINFSEQV